MKSLVRFSILLLAATVAVAQSSTPKKKTAPKPAPPAVTAADVQALRDALTAQQQQIEQLKQQRQQSAQSWQQSQQQLQQAQSTAAEAQQKASSAEGAANEEKGAVSKLSTDLADVKTTLTNNAVGTQEEQKRMSALEGVVNRVRFNGDVRIRGESFFQQGVFDRNRVRVRVRFGFDGKLNEDFFGGIYLATGSLGDPTTTNETLTNFFDRKTIGLDRGFITYNHRWLSLTGGKFAYQWQRTSVTGDPDINPEGFNEKLSWDLKTRWLKNFTIQGIEYLYNESNSGSTAVARQDSYTLGGQISAKLQFGPWTATPSFLSLKWNRPDSILQASAFAVQATTAGSTTVTPPINVPGEGPGCAAFAGSPATGNVPPCPLAANGMTNATVLDSSGRPHFYSEFNYADFILNNQIKTGKERLPLNLLLEFEENLGAQDHPLNSSGAVVPGLGKQNKEYGVDVSVGQTKNKNDVQFGYAWLRQEQDSVIASFAESDQRAPTNILQNRIYALWRVRANTVAGFTWWHGHTLNTFLENAVRATGVSAGQTEPYLNRLQFDLIYTF